MPSTTSPGARLLSSCAIVDSCSLIESLPELEFLGEQGNRGCGSIFFKCAVGAIEPGTRSQQTRLYRGALHPPG